MALVVFNDDQIKDLQRLSDKKDYPAAYSYMHGILAAETAKTENSARAKKRGQIYFSEWCWF